MVNAKRRRHRQAVSWSHHQGNVYKSSGKDAAGPHYCVILDTDEQIKKEDTYYVAVISHNDTIDADVIPVPSYTGLSGFIVPSWITTVDLPGITFVGGRILPPLIGELVKRAR